MGIIETKFGGLTAIQGQPLLWSLARYAERFALFNKTSNKESEANIKLSLYLVGTTKSKFKPLCLQTELPRPVTTTYSWQRSGTVFRNLPTAKHNINKRHIKYINKKVNSIVTNKSTVTLHYTLPRCLAALPDLGGWYAFKKSWMTSCDAASFMMLDAGSWALTELANAVLSRL